MFLLSFIFYFIITLGEAAWEQYEDPFPAASHSHDDEDEDQEDDQSVTMILGKGASVVAGGVLAK